MFVNYCQLRTEVRKICHSGDYFLDDPSVPGTFRRVRNQHVAPVSPGKMKGIHHFRSRKALTAEEIK
jgi:hypothetical protein